MRRCTIRLLCCTAVALSACSTTRATLYACSAVRLLYCTVRTNSSQLSMFIGIPCRSAKSISRCVFTGESKSTANPRAASVPDDVVVVSDAHISNARRHRGDGGAQSLHWRDASSSLRTAEAKQPIRMLSRRHPARCSRGDMVVCSRR